MKKILVFAAIVIAVISTSCNHQENIIQQYLKDNSNSGWAEVIETDIDTTNYEDFTKKIEIMQESIELVVEASDEMSKARRALYDYNFSLAHKYRDEADRLSKKADSLSAVADTTQPSIYRMCKITVKYREHNETGHKVITTKTLYSDTNCTTLYNDIESYIASVKL